MSSYRNMYLLFNWNFCFNFLQVSQIQYVQNWSHQTSHSLFHLSEWWIHQPAFNQLL